MVKENKLIYLIGIKGVAMAGLAVLLKELGYQVRGSDDGGTYITDKLLKKYKIEVFDRFDEQNLKGLKPEIIIASPAYGKDNPEVKEAKKRKISFLYFSEALSQFIAGKKLIAVSGTHGKTTITALVSYIFEKANLSPGFIIGTGEIKGLKANAQKGEGDYFIIEADEYRKSPENLQPKFLDYTPFIVIISSIEFDHPDVFPSVEEIYDAFYKLACHVPREGFIVLCTDYPKTKKIRQSLVDRDIETYGFESKAKWQIVNLKEQGGITEFFLAADNIKYGPFKLNIPGRFNVLNATAAIITALKCDVPEKTIIKALENFKGLERRFEMVGTMKNLTIIDDYAHHPTAVQETLQAAKEKFPEHKIWCVFQSHTFSRTEKLLEEFGQAFKAADKVIVTDIFASKRESKGGITGQDLALEIKKNQNNVRFISNWQEIKNYIRNYSKGPTVLITMGAGDVYKLGKELVKE